MRMVPEGEFMTNAYEQATVVVGVKRSGSSRAAIRVAARETRYQEAGLIAVVA